MLRPLLFVALTAGGCQTSGDPPWKWGELFRSSPADQPQQPAELGIWYRFQLNTGYIVDGQLVGGDAINYFVRTPYGLFSILRGQVVAMTPFAAQ